MLPLRRPQEAAKHRRWSCSSRLMPAYMASRGAARTYRASAAAAQAAPKPQAMLSTASAPAHAAWPRHRQTTRHTDTYQNPNNRLSWHGSKRACQRPRQPHSAALSMLMICHHLGECAGEPKLAIMLDTHTQGHAHPMLLGRKAPAGPEQRPTKPRHAAEHGPGGC